MSSKPRVCPNCDCHVPVDRGFFFDKDLNMICSKCKKVIFPATEEAEKERSRQKYSSKTYTNTHTNTHSNVRSMGYVGGMVQEKEKEEEKHKMYWDEM